MEESFPVLKSKRIILTTTELAPEHKELIERASWEYTIETSEELKVSDPLGVEILILSENRMLSKENVAKLAHLKFIQTLWAGVDSLNFEIIPESVTVCGNVGGFSEPIAEHAFGMMISLARNLLEHDRYLRQGRFDRSKMGIFLKGKKICILGTGGIGQAIARLAKAFRMNTLGINTSGKAVEFFDETGGMSKLDFFLSQSQFLAIALPLTNKTRNLLDSRRLGLLAEGCIIVNVGRGKIIDEKALYEYLLSHNNSKFGTDVWWKYPKEGEKFSQDYPFFQLQNFMGSPHNSNFVPESDEIALDNAVENILRYLKQEPLRGIAKREDYQRQTA
jgi:phosphoglycerate dehydrogenase-like enzyme